MNNKIIYTKVSTVYQDDTLILNIQGLIYLCKVKVDMGHDDACLAFGGNGLGGSWP